MAESEETKFLEAIGKRIDKIRREKKISFGRLADMTDLEKPTLVKITSKGSNVTARTLHKIATALGVSVKDFF